MEGRSITINTLHPNHSRVYRERCVWKMKNKGGLIENHVLLILSIYPSSVIFKRKKKEKKFKTIAHFSCQIIHFVEVVSGEEEKSR